MKKYIILLSLAFALGGCIDDDSNYNYKDLDKVEVSGVNTDLRVFLQESFSVIPTVNTTIPEESCQYTWRIMTDTLSRTKDLKYTFSSEPQSGKPLLFEVRDLRTNVVYTTEFTITVVSPFQNGWTVLHEKSGELQLNLISYDHPGMIYEDIYSLVNDEKLTGEPWMLKHMQANPSGSLSYNRMMILTSNNSLVLDAVTMKQLKDIETEYVPSMTTRPTFANYEYYSADSWICTINNGQPYGKKMGYADAPEDGWYEYPIEADENGISLAPYMQKANRSEYYIAFDKLNHRYVSIRNGTYNQTITSLNMSPTPVGFDPDNVNGTCVGIFRSQSLRAVSIVRMATNNYQVHVFTNEIDWNTSGYPVYWTLLGTYEFPVGEITDQTVFDVHGSAPYLLYSKGAELKALNLEAFSSGTDALNSIVTYDGDITAIRHAYSTAWNASYNEFAIAIQPAVNPGSASLLIVDPLLTANGEILRRYDNVGGIVKFICYKY